MLLQICLSIMDINDYLVIYAIFTNIRPFLTSGHLNFDLGKNDPNSFERTLNELSNVFPSSLRCLRAELVGWCF